MRHTEGKRCTLTIKSRKCVARLASLEWLEGRIFLSQNGGSRNDSSQRNGGPALGNSVANLSSATVTAPTRTATPSRGSGSGGAVSADGLSSAIYVSPTGSDSNPGTEAAPFQTLAQARDFVRIAAREEDADTLFFNRRLVVEGDTDTALLVKNTLDAIEAPRARALLRKMGTVPIFPKSEQRSAKEKMGSVPFSGTKARPPGLTPID